MSNNRCSTGLPSLAIAAVCVLSFGAFCGWIGYEHGLTARPAAVVDAADPACPDARPAVDFHAMRLRQERERDLAWGPKGDTE